jgi:hypothetical protein
VFCPLKSSREGCTSTKDGECVALAGQHTDSADSGNTDSDQIDSSTVTAKEGRSAAVEGGASEPGEVSQESSSRLGAWCK